MDRRDFLAAAAAGAASLVGRDAAGAEQADRVAPKKARWPFYAFDNGLRGKALATVEAKCALLKQLGYDGIEYHLNPRELPRMLEQLDKRGLKMFGIYTVPTLEAGIPADWGQWIKLLKGRAVRIEMALRSKKHRPSDPAGDGKALAMVRAVSDLCADTGPVVSIYPHAGFWTERVDDGVRLAAASGRKNVGTNFNLVHWQWVKQPRPLETVLREARRHLLLVTLNGLKGPASKRQKIRPLDDSDYDLLAFLRLVRKVGYTGPVGLQCWSVREPSAEHLKRSKRAWRALVRKLPSGP